MPRHSSNIQATVSAVTEIIETLSPERVDDIFVILAAKMPDYLEEKGSKPGDPIGSRRLCIKRPERKMLIKIAKLWLGHKNVNWATTSSQDIYLLIVDAIAK